MLQFGHQPFSETHRQIIESRGIIVTSKWVTLQAFLYARKLTHFDFFLTQLHVSIPRSLRMGITTTTLIILIEGLGAKKA